MNLEYKTTYKSEHVETFVISIDEEVNLSDFINHIKSDAKNEVTIFVNDENNKLIGSIYVSIDRISSDFYFKSIESNLIKSAGGFNKFGGMYYIVNVKAKTPSVCVSFYDLTSAFCESCCDGVCQFEDVNDCEKRRRFLERINKNKL